MSKENQCVFCKQNANYCKNQPFTIYNVECPNCGKYKITREQFDNIRNNPNELKSLWDTDTPADPRPLISGYIQEVNLYSNSPPCLSREIFKTILKSIKFPVYIGDKYYKLLLYFYKKTSHFGESINVKNKTSICYTNSTDEIEHLCEELCKEGYIKESTSPYEYSITIKGIEKAHALEHAISPTNNVFIAMSFDKSYDRIYENGIIPAVEECGYNPIRVDRRQHNDDITDWIIADIRKSKFLIADFTGNRGGVYYEAGFARGPWDTCDIHL